MIEENEDEIEEIEDDWLLDLAAVVTQYKPDVLPGQSQADITTGLFVGFTKGQLVALSAKEDLRRLVGRYFDEFGPNDILWQIAGTDSWLGRGHQSLLASFGYLDKADSLVAEVDRISTWLALADAPQALLSKSESTPAADTWTLGSEFVDANITITVDADSYWVSFVPEKTRGNCWLAVQWRDHKNVELIAVDCQKEKPVRIQLLKFGRTLEKVAITGKEAK